MKTYEEIQKEELLFKVNGENQTNKVLNSITPKILDIFEGLEGKQVLKSGASFNYAELLKKYSDKTNLIIKEEEKVFSNKDITTIIFLECSVYSVYISVRLRFNNLRENGFLYYDNQKYILNLRDLKIINLYEFEELNIISGEAQYKTFLNCLKLLDKLKKEKEKLKPYNLTKMIK